MNFLQTLNDKNDKYIKTNELSSLVIIHYV